MLTGKIYTVEELAGQPGHFGRMNSPDAASCVKGPCGDEMEFYLVIRDDRIREISFFTAGCRDTVSCGEMLSRLVEGTEISVALGISPKQIGDKVRDLSPEHRHCLILAVNSFFNAVAGYMLMP